MELMSLTGLKLSPLLAGSTRETFCYVFSAECFYLLLISTAEILPLFYTWCKKSKTGKSLQTGAGTLICLVGIMPMGASGNLIFMIYLYVFMRLSTLSMFLIKTRCID